MTSGGGQKGEAVESEPSNSPVTRNLADASAGSAHPSPPGRVAEVVGRDSPSRQTVHCRSHCSPCGRHFSSMAAFDAHHRHDENRYPVCYDPERDEECMDPETGESRFIALTVDGKCSMYAEVQAGVTVWTLRKGLEEARRRFGRVEAEDE